MTGLRVESGVISSSVFRELHGKTLQAEFPSLQLSEAVSVPAAARALARAVERFQPAASRLVRVHHCLWLRMFLDSSDTASVPGQIRDVVCSIDNIPA